jgi:hypothetical protein
MCFQLICSGTVWKGPGFLSMCFQLTCSGTVWKGPGFLSMCFQLACSGTVWKDPGFPSMCFQLTCSGHRVEGPGISPFVFSTHLQWAPCGRALDFYLCVFNSPVAGTVWKGPGFLSMCFQLACSGHRVEGPWIPLYVFSTHL